MFFSNKILFLFGLNPLSGKLFSYIKLRMRLLKVDANTMKIIAFFFADFSIRPVEQSLTAGAIHDILIFHQEEESQREYKPFPYNQWLRFMVAFSHVQRPFSGLSL